MIDMWQSILRLVVLCIMLSGTVGCAARQPHPASVEESAGIERPAHPLEEEETFWDRAGEVGIVLLIVGITVAGILLPILLL